MNELELNAILYYADFLSLQHTSTPVTDTCKYFYVFGVPINMSCLVGLQPEYDEENQYFKQAKKEYELIKNKFGKEGVFSFIEDICSIKACGSVDVERMLNYIHRYNSKSDKKRALATYYKWKNNKKYYHTVSGEDGEPRTEECTKYIAHYEKVSK